LFSSRGRPAALPRQNSLFICCPLLSSPHLSLPVLPVYYTQRFSTTNRHTHVPTTDAGRHLTHTRTKTKKRITEESTTPTHSPMHTRAPHAQATAAQQGNHFCLSACLPACLPPSVSPSCQRSTSGPSRHLCPGCPRPWPSRSARSSPACPTAPWLSAVCWTTSRRPCASGVCR